MTFVRSVRRTAVAGLSLMALLAAAACGGDGGGEPAPQAPGDGGAGALTGRGPIEFWQGKDTAGATKPLIEGWNAAHPDEKVTLKELPDNADLQRQQMIQNTQIKNPAMAVISVDVVWVGEFAANGYIVELPADQFSTEGLLPATVDSGTYFNKLYTMPTSSDGGMLYYRKDLLEKYDVQPPTTWDEMRAACKTIQAGEKDIDCYAGQYQKYEGLTVNFAEAVHSAGGRILGEDGKPALNTPEAAQGLQALVDMYKDGVIPKGAITWTEEPGRTAFQEGKLIFHRNWSYVYALASKDDQIAGKFGLAPLPGLKGPGVSSLGGHNYAIAANAQNKATAADFIKYAASEEVQRAVSAVATVAPTATALYEDQALVEKYPFFPILRKSIETAAPRPKAHKYGDVTLAIQDAAYAAIQGQTPVDEALATLQTKLETLTQQ